MVWTLALQGWRYWNKNAVLHGESVGARARRWWWRTNNWVIPKGFAKNKNLAAEMGDVSWPRIGNIPCFTDIN